MNVNNEDLIKALETVENEFVKIRDKYQKKQPKNVQKLMMYTCLKKYFTNEE